MPQPAKPAKMPVSRMRMRPWLEQQINSRSIDGLTWLNAEKTMFSIPWKHAARHGWEMEKDASLFKMWAIHTGKYEEGKACDPKTWKANFRCAMNSLPDVEEVKNMSSNKGHQAARVFKMLPTIQKKKDKRRKAKRLPRMRESYVESEQQTDSSETQSSTDESMTNSPPPQENTVDSTGDIEMTYPEIKFNSLLDVPDISMCIEIEDLCQRKFQLSPDYTPDDIEYDIIQLCKDIDRDSPSFLLNNNTCASLESHCSAAVEDLNFNAQYTVLGSDFSRTLWSSFQT